MKILLIALSFLLTHCFFDSSSKDDSGTNQNGSVDTSTAAITQTQEEGTLLYAEYQVLMGDDGSCSSAACINKKAELDAVLEKLDGLIDSNYYADSLTYIRKHVIIAITDDTLFLGYMGYSCKGGELLQEVGSVGVAYQLEDDGLHSNIHDCSYRLYSGSSTSLIGDWTFERRVLNSTDSNCVLPDTISDNLEKRLKQEWKLSVSENEILYEDVHYYNCLVDDLVGGYQEYETFNKIDCSQFEFMEYGLTTHMSINATSDFLENTTTYTYKGEHCTVSEKDYFDSSVKPECGQPDCFVDVLGQYCEDHQEQNPTSASDEYSNWLRAGNVCSEYWSQKVK